MDVDEAEIAITMFSGESVVVRLPPSGLVKDLREHLEKDPAFAVPAGSFLNLLNGGHLLLDSMSTSIIDQEQATYAMVVQVQTLEGLLQAAGLYEGYAELFRAAAEDATASTGDVVVGPMPDILTVLEDMSLGQTSEMPNLKRGDSEGILAFNGTRGDLLLPSLDLQPTLAALGLVVAPRVTICVGVNSDSYNRGLGIAVQASALVEDGASEGGVPWHVYHGYGHGANGRGNSVKFHPGMEGGQLRLEGQGGWANAHMSFTPQSWTESDKKLHTLEITVTPEGNNKLRFIGTGPGEVWDRSWSRQLFDGRRLPALFAWLDLGGVEGKPLHIGPVTVRIHRDVSDAEVAA